MVVPRKHFTLLQFFCSQRLFSRCLHPVAVSGFHGGSSTSPFLDDDAEDLLLLSTLAFLSRDLAVVVSTAEDNLCLLDRDAYLAASTLPLTTKNACRRSEIRAQAVFGPSAPGCSGSSRRLGHSHVFDHDHLCQGGGLYRSPSASVSTERKRVWWMWSSRSPAAAASSTATAVQQDQPRGRGAFSGVLADRDVVEVSSGQCRSSLQ